MAFEPNALFFEMCEIFADNFKGEDKVIIANEGGSRCFAKGTKVITKRGLVDIDKINIGDNVLTYNESTKVKEYKEVIEPLMFQNSKKTFKVKLKNGKFITATEDHEFYHEGSWKTLKHLLSLWDGRNMERITNDAE